jgi:hypothetical protein
MVDGARRTGRRAHALSSCTAPAHCSASASARHVSLSQRHDPLGRQPRLDRRLNRGRARRPAGGCQRCRRGRSRVHFSRHDLQLRGQGRGIGLASSSTAAYQVRAGAGETGDGIFGPTLSSLEAV